MKEKSSCFVRSLWQYTVMHNQDGNPLNRLRISWALGPELANYPKAELWMN